MPTELFKILYPIGIGQSIILALILLVTKDNRPQPRTALATFLLVMGCMLWHAYAELPRPGGPLWHSPILFASSLWLIGPSIWLYVTGLTRETLPGAWPHLLPFCVVFMIHLGLWVAGETMPRALRVTIMLTMYTQATIYIGASIRELLAHKRRVEASLSSPGRQSLAWLKLLVATFLGLWLLDFAVVGLDLIYQRASRFAYQLLMLTEAAWLIAVAFIALRQPDILHRQLIAGPADKYKTSALSPAAATELTASLNALMSSQKPHLENGLTLSELAQRLGVTPHLLSQLLNDTLQSNFYEFVNRARVREAAALLRSDRWNHSPIIDIAYQAGFSNKNSFNRAFRKYANCTPSEYRRRVD